MARIRTIKPEIWTSAKFVECSFVARLFFIALLNFCDDQGAHVYSLKRLKMEIFPGDDFSLDEIEGFLKELYSQHLIGLYSVDNQVYIKVLGWSHQRIDHRNIRGYLPSSDEIFTNSTTPIPEAFPDHSRIVPVSFPQGNCTIGREGKGREGKGIKEKQEKEKPAKLSTGNAALKKQATEVLEFLNSKTDHRYRPEPSTLKPIIARLKSGVPVAHCKAVIAAMCKKWETMKNSDGKPMADYLRPSTIFGAQKFENYLGQLNWKALDSPPEEEHVNWAAIELEPPQASS